MFVLAIGSLDGTSDIPKVKSRANRRSSHFAMLERLFRQHWKRWATGM